MIKKTVCIVGGDYPYLKMFRDEGWTTVAKPEEADFLLFTGGADVMPSLYNQEELKCTHTNPGRDKQEIDLFDEWVGHKNMLGICRGGQFLNVMNGGSLWQDVNGHAIAGTHRAVDLTTGKKIQVTSTHHQMMRPDLEVGKLLCVASGSTSRQDDRQTMEGVNFDDVEVVYYPNTDSLCFQPHPEHAGAEQCRRYFFNLIDMIYGATA